MKFEAVIGLEIHAQLKTETKIFCSCRARFGDIPNTNTCPVCLGMPGVLPVLNRKAVTMAIRAGIATQCTIAEKSVFARKNYFYPDLPKGYQISQYDLPLCADGYVEIDVDGQSKRIGIRRIHLEEDAGKLIHDQGHETLLDVNRCGTPLAEIVTDPDIHTPQEAYAYLVTLKQILEYLDICDCNMEEGSLRCDANISIRPVGEKKLGTKTELKNMNSFRGVEKALAHEFQRQKDIVESGGRILQQTFLWDADKNITLPMRSKEEAHDYRYFPEPDLVPLIVDKTWIQQERNAVPELPNKRLARFMDQYTLSREHAAVLTDNRPIADYYEKTVQECNDPQRAAFWIMTEVLRLCKDTKRKVTQLAVTPQRLGTLITMIKQDVVSSSAGKKIFSRIEQENKDPQQLVEQMGLAQVSDTDTLATTVDQIIAKYPEEVKRFNSGEKKLMSFFMGEAMKKTKGKGNPKEISKIFNEKLR